MKRFGLAVLGAFVLVFISMTGTTYLSVAAPASGPGSPAPTETKAREFNGKVVSMDAQAQRLVVKNKKSESGFVLTSKTAYKKGRNAIQPVSLKPGASVRIRYYEQNGQRIASRVTITSAATASSKEGGNE